MSNLAYKYNEDYYSYVDAGIKVDTRLKPKVIVKPKVKGNKVFSYLAVYSLMFLSIGTFYINSIVEKTKINIKIESLQNESATLKTTLSRLKVDLDKSDDLMKIEEISNRVIGMEMIDEVTYIKLK